MSSRHLVSTTAAEARCDRCRRPLLVALDEGLTARVDATPLPDHSAELAALIEGRWTYTRIHGQLIHRTAPRITANPIGSVHAEHRCPKKPTQLTIDQIGQK